MAAGLGFKTFTTGEVLTAADVNGYLMQGILVFASEAARNSAITSPQEGQFAFTKDTNSLWYYTGSAWVASGAAGDIEGVTAGVGISGGGTSGTVTITNSMATAIDAKGDLVPGTGADTFSRLAVGANGTVLTADSAEATGLKWAAPSSGALTLISNTSFDSTGYAIDSVFSTTYELYLIEWYAYQQNVVNQTASFRFRNTSGDITSGYYGSCFGYNTGGTLSTISTSNASAWTLPEGDAYTGSKFSMVFNRNTNHLSGTMITTTYDDNKRIFTGGCVVAGTITGMKLQYGGSGSYGKLAIYGMAKA